MALVSYSDSEGSDSETPANTKPPAPASTSAKPYFQKTSSRKIKVELPTLQPEPDAQDAIEPSAKRAKTAGAFGGFNSLLPAPQRGAPAQNGLGKGVGLKTSSEAAFNRALPAVTNEDDETEQDAVDVLDAANNTSTQSDNHKPSEEKEVKIVGRATRFKPLSVANNRKKVSKKYKVTLAETAQAQFLASQEPSTEKADVGDAKSERAKKERRSLFSVPQDLSTELAIEVGITEGYQPVIAPNNTGQDGAGDVSASHQSTASLAGLPANSLEAVAADLNLTPAQRRQLLGRSASATVNVASFSIDNEYAANEQIRQSGETLEHHAVKSIAPGKHSLQQLVNNARSNQDSIEDKWAEGRRNRGESGSKYGWK